MAREVAILVGAGTIDRDITEMNAGEDITIKVLANGYDVGDYQTITFGDAPIDTPRTQSSGVRRIPVPYSDFAALPPRAPNYYNLWAVRSGQRWKLAQGRLIIKGSIVPLDTAPVSPSLVTAGTIVATDNGATVTYTFTEPLGSGNPSPAAMAALTLDGAVVTGDMDGLRYTVSKLPGATRNLVMVYTLSNGVLPDLPLTPLSAVVPVLALSPTVTVPASVSLVDNGDSVTFTFVEPIMAGTPAPSITPYLQLDGTDVTSGMVGLTYTATKTDSIQSLNMVFTGTNGVAPDATSPVSTSVPAEVVVVVPPTPGNFSSAFSSAFSI